MRARAYERVRVCVRMCVCAYARMCVCTQASGHGCTCVCTWASAGGCTRVHMRACIRVQANN